MGEMVERVAEAVAQTMKRQTLEGTPTSAETIARVAIAAMREPTEGMLSAGYECSEAATAVWQTMIDAAVN